jgi:hypothetical protein
MALEATKPGTLEASDFETDDDNLIDWSGLNEFAEYFRTSIPHSLLQHPSMAPNEASERPPQHDDTSELTTDTTVMSGPVQSRPFRQPATLFSAALHTADQLCVEASMNFMKQAGRTRTKPSSGD